MKRDYSITYFGRNHLMKIDRQLGIITLLLQRNRVTAPELAKRFEVTRRTILRDVDDICRAGIPVITLQGGGGGIAIAEGYKLDKSVLTVDEMENIIVGLGSIGSVTDTSRMQSLISKLAPEKEGVVSMRDSILIDLSSHYKASLSEKIALIRDAISRRKLVCFDYYSAKGTESRVIEPCFIAFKWSSWYVLGYCCQRNAFRLFKLNRLWRLRVTDDNFTPREIRADKFDTDKRFNDANKLTVLFDKAVEYLVVEEYGPDSYDEMDDGRLRLTIGYTNREYIVRWILGFGDKAKVLEPEDLADEIEGIAENILKLY